MNAEIKADWVAALRSGKFAQGKGKLRQGDKHCCLGVLSELAVQVGVISPPNQINDDVFMYNGEYLSLPVAVVKWAGLDSCNPRPVGSDDCLAGLNDSGLSFTEIADLIEEGL